MQRVVGQGQMIEVDYVIIGAGSAGCVLANALSKDGDQSVLVLEAGPMDRNLMIHIPAGVYNAYRNPKINWNYQSAPEPALDNRSIDTPRGRVVGGSSSINSMVYMRGHPLDYDRWADEHGLTQWRYADCLPYFKAGESYDRGGDEWRGGEGPLGVSHKGADSPLYDAFLAAGEEAGQGRSDDLNGYQPEGVARLDATRRNGRRCSAAVAHLHPALGRANLRLETNAMVDQLTLAGNRVTGVIYTQHGVQYQVQAILNQRLICPVSVRIYRTTPPSFCNGKVNRRFRSIRWAIHFAKRLLVCVGWRGVMGWQLPIYGRQVA